ncbi:MAG: glycerophosphodiester phosphodiesterase [Clostridiales bacterium]|nr:glycerophosphodiester phosphodiesterase [Clostridiales bacterium]
MQETYNFLLDNYIAHRGFHNSENPENTIGAFNLAIEKGYAIELDVQLLKDGTVVVVHDNKLSRLCGVDKYISNCNLEDLQDLYVLNSSYQIPTLKQVLEFVDGKVPLLIEIKNTLKVGDLESKTYELLKDYTGNYAVQSFNPFSLEWFKKNAPNVLRGQLSSFFKGEDLSFIKKTLLKKLRLNKVSNPHFISYNAENLPNRYCNKCKLPILAWTIRSQEEYLKVIKFVDNIIFEGFEPKI